MDEVVLADYDPRWPAMYEAEAARVLAVLPAGLALAVEHVGSTAIAGLIAKPVIDILVVVRSVAVARETAVPPMQAAGYAFWEDNPKRDRLFFVRGLPPAPQRTHHVHMTEPDGALWNQVVFRDHLRADPGEATAYASLKRDPAERHAEDREAYTAAKSAYIAAAVAKARRSSKASDPSR